MNTQAVSATDGGTTAYGGEASAEGRNRRIDDRLPMSIRVRYPRRNAFFFEYTRNISHGGMFIATSQPFDIGTRFRFELEVPGEDEPISLLGEVRWTVEPRQIEGMSASAPDVDAGMGIQFIFDADGAREAFEARVRGMVEDAFGPHISRQLFERQA